MPSKDKGLRIRVEQELRDEFLVACHAEDKPAAQVLREFMREYVRQHHPTAQLDMFRSNDIEMELER